MRKTRLALAAALATAAFAAFGAGSASALTTTQQVQGTPLGTLALGVPAPSPFVFTSFGPGVNATGTSAVLVTSTNAWSLQVGDHDTSVAHTAGHMYNTGLGTCPAGAEAQTANALSIDGAGTTALGTIGSSAISVSGTDTQIAHGAVTDTVLSNIGMNVGAGETMGTGCVYQTTLTYTLQ